MSSYRGHRTNLKKYPKMSYHNRDFLDMATCPVCVQVLTPKPVDDYSVREIMHIESHVQNPIIDKELEMFL